MHGAGNDFVVLDATRGPLGLSPAHYRFLGDRHLGVGADQILTVGPSPAAGIDFEYSIHNADGNQVEQCGNGARCFARFVREQGLSDKTRLRVKTMKGVIEPELHLDGRVTVDMGPPSFDLAAIGFDTQGLAAHAMGDWQYWPLSLNAADSVRLGARYRRHSGSKANIANRPWRVLLSLVCQNQWLPNQKKAGPCPPSRDRLSAVQAQSRPSWF